MANAFPVRWMIAFAAVGLHAGGASAAPDATPPFVIHRAAGPIVVDGDLSDAGWQGVPGITRWYETNVGDNVEPQVGNTAYLTYDDRYFYAAFVFEDPDPAAIRAPLGDHDAVNSPTDYGGLILDSRNDGRTAQMFLANPRGVQYDAISSDASGEDNSPDWFWDSAGRITDRGWNLEIRVPFTSLRYGNEAEPQWNVLLYRNYPRDRRYQFFSTRLPREVSCFICNATKLVGLADLPRGSHLVVAPFATTSRSSFPRDSLGSPLEAEDVDSDAGVDIKWSPSADVAIDGTWNPDFSQIESDAAQIAANERFALFFAEKRPFFLEGVDLFATPLQAVYTRTVTAPRGGLRATGKSGGIAYTALYAQDKGGGLVILPGVQGSDAAPQDFTSDVGIVRLRRDLGASFASVLATTREVRGGGFNRVVGPDFEWRPRPADRIAGQFLWSETRTPDRTDLADAWDGRDLSDGAGVLFWSHSTGREDWYLQGQNVGTRFRADDGFIPQVGYRELYGEAGWTFRPRDQFLSRVRVFTINSVDQGFDDAILARRYSVGAGMDGRANSFFRTELNREEYLVADRLLRRLRPRFYLEASPGSLLNHLTVDSYVGQEIDFANGREGTGVTLIGSVQIRPGAHLDIVGNVSRRWVDVDSGGSTGRLFTAQVERMRATWAFDARSFVRVIGQYVDTRREPDRYTFEVDPRESSLTGSVLFAYKLNWQTVLYAGYGDERTFAEASDRLEPSGRDLFAKLSYAWQR